MINYRESLKSDIPAGIVVFLVALPLCLGIALASGAPLLSGVIAGIIGGIVVGAFSGSQLSVSGPAAGLTVIVLTAIENLQTFEAFLLAVVIAGILQLIFGFLKAGIIGHFFPSSVIKGMLAAIGVILILKQIPHALGDDRDYEGDDAFFQPDGENTFTEIILAVQNIDAGALVISLICLVLLVAWDRPQIKKLSFTKVVPGPLIAVALGVIINEFFYGILNPEFQLKDVHLVALPVAKGLDELSGLLTFPDFSAITNPQVYVVAITIAIIASLETLLSLDAVDKLDPAKRIAPPNTELKAQGLGNLISGLIGGLPLTAVIIRSTANISSGAKTKVSAVLHGFLLLASVLAFPALMNKIPLSALAAVLLVVGFKLTRPSLYKEMLSKGMDQFAPFIITIVAILFTDLLRGIGIGIVSGVFFVIRANLHRAMTVSQEGNTYTIKMEKDVFFLNKAFLRKTLRTIPDGSHVIIDDHKTVFMDHDIRETIEDFRATAISNEITMEMKPPKLDQAEKVKAPEKEMEAVE